MDGTQNRATIKCTSWSERSLNKVFVVAPNSVSKSTKHALRYPLKSALTMTHETVPRKFGLVAGLGLGAGIFYYRSRSLRLTLPAACPLVFLWRTRTSVALWVMLLRERL